nr:hypothetical protein [Anaerolineae bacterium]
MNQRKQLQKQMLRSQPDRSDVKSWKRRYTQGILRSVVILIGLIALTVFIAIRSHRVEVTSIVTTTGVDNDGAPVDQVASYSSLDPAFYVAVQVENYSPDVSVSAQWEHDGDLIAEAGPDNVVYGRGWLFFSLVAPVSGWDAGFYAVTILQKDRALGSRSFEVVSTGE